MSYPLYNNYYKFNLSRIIWLSKHIKSKFIFYKPQEIKNKIFKSCINIFNPDKFKNYGYILLEDNPEDNKELNYLTDYFTLEERIKASFINNKSPIEYFKENKKEIIKNLNLKSINEIVNIDDWFKFDKYMFDHVRFTNNFRISIILKILDVFKPTKWLDISSGWGDRLISAILSPTIKKYYSTDPNLDLHKHYDDIREKFNVSKKDYKIKKTGFEKLKIKDYDFDFIFSSPPFFKTEKYSDYPDDSLVNFDSEKDWYENFLLFSIIKALKHLKVNCYFILNMKFHSNKDSYLSNQRLITDLNKIENLKNCGSIYYFNHHNYKPRELFVFKKLGDIC